VPTAPAPSATGIPMPGDPGWDGARQAWNLAVDRRPAVIALPPSAAEVAAAVTFARPPVTAGPPGAATLAGPDTGPHLEEGKEFPCPSRFAPLLLSR
jgi:hypothetical protein